MCGKCPKGYTNSGTKQCKKATATKKPTTKLVLAGKGKANCAGKGAAVKGISGCKVAAKSMKKTFGTVTNSRYPKGCFFLNNKVYFNPGKTGKGHGAASPICVAKAGATKKPAKKLVLAANGKPNCAGKGVAVKNENACKAAAKAMKKAFSGSGAYASYPKGCFLISNKFYYNKGKTGKANSKARPVCVSGATGGKKTTPKKKPANPCAKNNGGCAKARKCMNVKGKAMCGKCPKGYTNSGKKQCKKATATKKPTKKLVLAGKGKANCAGKGTAVKGQNGCKAA